MLQLKQGDSCTGFELSGVLKREPEPGPLLCGVPEGRGALERMAPFLRGSPKASAGGPAAVWFAHCWRSLLARAADLKNVPSRLPSPRSA